MEVCECVGMREILGVVVVISMECSAILRELSGKASSNACLR